MAVVGNKRDKEPAAHKMPVPSKSEIKRLMEINDARKLSGLSPVRFGVRSCVACSAEFFSSAARCCPVCNSRNASKGVHACESSFGVSGR